MPVRGIQVVYYSELPEIPKTTKSGQYFEFEQIANGVDGYFDGNSDTDDENFDGSEVGDIDLFSRRNLFSVVEISVLFHDVLQHASFAFDMSSVRRFRRSSKSPPEIYPRKRLGNGRTMHRIDVRALKTFLGIVIL